MTDRRASDRYRRQTDKLIMLARLGIAIVLVGFAIGGYAIVTLIQRNTKAILVSCTLIANVATEAGAAGGREGTSKAAQKQQEITALAFDVLIRDMTPAERAKLARLNAQLAAAGGFVALPNCRQVAKHPESVEQRIRQPTQRKP